MLLLRRAAAGTCGWVCEAVSASADFFSITTLPGAVRRHSDPKHIARRTPGECDVMQRC